MHCDKLEPKCKKEMEVFIFLPSYPGGSGGLGGRSVCLFEIFLVFSLYQHFTICGHFDCFGHLTTKGLPAGCPPSTSLRPLTLILFHRPNSIIFDIISELFQDIIINSIIINSIAILECPSNISLFPPLM